MASVRSCLKLPPCLTEPMPASSKTDPPRLCDNIFKKGKKTALKIAVKRGVRRCERTNSADTKVSEGGGGGA